MKLIVPFQVPKKHYQADASVVWCFDDRCNEHQNSLLDAFIEAMEFKHVDLITEPGGAVVLARFQTYPTYSLIDRIIMSLELHSASLVVLMVHVDCAKYKGLGLGEEAVKKEWLAQDLAAAEQRLSKALETKKLRADIKKVIVDFDGLWETEE